MSRVYSQTGKYPIQVSKWKHDYSDIDFIANDFSRKMIACAVFCRKDKDGIKYAIFRERLEGDPEDLEDQSQTLPNEMLREILAFKESRLSPTSTCKREIDLLIDDNVWKTISACDMNIMESRQLVIDECQRRKMADGREHYHTVHLKGNWREDNCACKS